MGKFFKTIWITIVDFFDKYFVVITILVGIIFLSFGILNKTEGSEFAKLFHTIGSIALASGIFAGIAKSNQFTEIYKKIVRDIIYGNEHLEKRNDLEKIWENVTQTLSNKKFERISDNMNENIKKYFLPLEHDYYYDNFNIDIIIESIKDDPEHILLKEHVSYTIICDDENLKIVNKYKTFYELDVMGNEKINCKINKLTIDNEEQKNIDIQTGTIDNVFTLSYEKILTGSKKYKIQREVERTYNVIRNPIRKQMAVWIYNNCQLNITYPKDMSIEFHNMGLLNEFKLEHRNTTFYNRMQGEYKGLIYKNQGFFIYIKKK